MSFVLAALAAAPVVAQSADPALCPGFDPGAIKGKVDSRGMFYAVQ